jgi:hypothetical protein
MAILLKLSAIDFDNDPAIATFVFETDEEDDDDWRDMVVSFPRDLRVVGSIDASVAATAAALAVDLRAMADLAEKYADDIKSGKVRP